ncbi:TIGR04282 family arsenosugar biosynthesis glycosyltransferase [Sciscionella marina]|uniref:TIGR04282 family arsenosugar biosynthesis glycosyltransferase n=1 Tax=Sciscionella marina TaxID=508770 RepID=UPI0003702C9C|nr:DUF2064 domain-containing protein [Sciscionella marina]
MNHVILVLAKAPRAGAVKTRLCPPATPRAAARIAAAALLDTLDAAAATPDAQLAVALSGDLDDAEDRVALHAALGACTVFAQRGDNLGERIVAAHAEVAARFPGMPVLQIGMDTPQVTPSVLRSGAAPLVAGTSDAVFGHAEDGGWWLLGLRDPLRARLIIEVPTSRPDTGARTEEALRAAGLSIHALPVLSDVDTGKDAVAVAANAPHGRFAAAVGALL